MRKATKQINDAMDNTIVNPKDDAQFNNVLLIADACAVAKWAIEKGLLPEIHKEGIAPYLEDED